MNRIERLLRWVDTFQQRHSVLGFPFGVIKKYGDDQGGKKAALLAHYGFLSLFPLLLVFLTVLGYALAKDPQLQQGVIDTLARQFPVLGPQVEDSISTIQGSGIALVVGILGTLWGGLGITQSFQDAMNDIWNVPRRQRPNFWLRLARGLAALLLVAGEVVAATVLAQLGIAGPGLLGRLDLLAGSLLLNLLLLLVMFQLLTGTRLRWRWLLPGAAVGALGWSVLQTVGVQLVNHQLERANLLYGVFAGVLVLLGWLYLSTQLVVYAAEVNVVLARRLWPRSLLQPPLTEPDRRVLTALARTEERRPEQRVEVTFLPEGGDSDDQPAHDREPG
ncbi:MAG TPA: YihY/virulence factor BrkB family protein [Actinomycetota bacterium]|nr:YihY/virulence factor BrkB family protein [Actinomycetota bacterium]